ncbi:MAG: thymidylate synthase [Polaribacter sp.]|jgi:thymidylate synthase
MAIIDKEFRKLCVKIMEEGREYEDKRRDVKRLQIPSYTFKHSFSDGFPAITSKKLYQKGITTELIWFLRGDNDIEFLNKNNVLIWNKDAYNWYLKNAARLQTKFLTLEEFSHIGKGSVGQNYSVQWRKFNGVTDQIDDIIKNMKSNIMGTGLKVNAWNPSETKLTALPPCHSEFQVVGIPLNLEERLALYSKKCSVENRISISVFLTKSYEEATAYLNEENIPEFGFELHWNQRSVDTFLGLPFNIASYGFLAKILEGLTGFPALGIEGTLKCVHFYDNQYEAVKELISRDTMLHGNCELAPIKDLYPEFPIDYCFNKLTSAHFKLINYSSFKAIKVEMLAPKNL